MLGIGGIKMAGRVLSKANETKLRAAAAELAAVLKLLGEEGDDGDDGAAVDNGRAADSEEAKEAALSSEYTPLVEQAVRRDGTMEIRVISAGWGSSGYYPAEVLERDGPRVFGKGTKMFIDHPTATEEAQRPEGSVRDLAAELISDARWVQDHPKGAGLYADAKVFQPYQPMVEELAPHIGVSIRAVGKAKQGAVEGREGRIISELTAAKSIDLVTEPGANGRIIQMFEAARPARQLTMPLAQEASVNEQQFQEAMTRLETQNKELAAQASRLQEALLLRDARDLVREALKSASVPDVTKARLLEQLSANPPVNDRGELDKTAFAARIAEAVKVESDYLTQAAGYGSGRIEGMGATPANVAVDNAAVEAQMADAFTRLGLSESGVQAAVNGRSW